MLLSFRGLFLAVFLGRGAMSIFLFNVVIAVLFFVHSVNTEGLHMSRLILVLQLIPPYYYLLHSTRKLLRTRRSASHLMCVLSPSR